MSHARPAARPAIALAAGVAAALLAFAPPDPASARRVPKKHKKPGQAHLVFKHVEVKAPAFAFLSKETTFTLKVKLANTGQAVSDRTRVHLLLTPRPQQAMDIGRVVIDTAVPHLRPGHAVNLVRHGTFGGESLGRYKVSVCRAGGKCFTRRPFYVVEEEWVGQIHGVGPVNGAAGGERWDGVPATLEFDRYLGKGAFRYDFKGEVAWVDHGINSGGCLWQGQDSEEVDENLAGPGIVLDYLNGFYKGKETLHDPFYTVTASGGGGFPCHATAPAPANKTFLTIPKRKLGFDQNVLKGQAGSALAESTQWKWNFKS